MRMSNGVSGCLNFIILLLSIPILAGGIWLNHKANTTDCEQFMVKPMIVLGVFLLLVSIAGIIGACCRVNWLLWVYLLVMFILILLLFCFTIFAFVVTNKGAGQAVSGKGYKEYRLGDYSHWLQKRVTDTKNWNKIRSCLIDGNWKKRGFGFIRVMEESLIDASFRLNSIFWIACVLSGCCKPSSDCGFTYVTPTSWTKPDQVTSSNEDCNSWNNDESVLCYNCNACKAGVLQNIKGHWKKIAIVNIIVLVILVIIYSLGCYAFRNNREDNYNNQWKWKPNY